MPLSRIISCVAFISLFIFLSFKIDVWGFYGHRKINEMAIYTLPPEMFGFFKKHVGFISEHAVDPDKRRYATKFEAIRHYIDIDHWGENPFDSVPRRFDDALLKYGTFHFVEGKDTSDINVKYMDEMVELNFSDQSFSLSYNDFRKIFQMKFQPKYYDEDMRISSQEFNESLDFEFLRDESGDVLFMDHFSEYGICPYNLITMYHRMVNAFADDDKSRILNLLADFGHYVGDAHVPLHTTENYNGQLTGQDGIHAFWESRIVELYDGEFDFLVGKAEYIDDINSFVWQIVEDSYNLVDSVLLIEKRLRESYPSDRQFCYDERLNNTLRIECPEFARAYMLEMDGMVEKRMVESVHALGSLWYTAWVDAGQPDLEKSDIVESEVTKEIEFDPKVKSKARLHE
jgi:hypothetical protein